MEDMVDAAGEGGESRRRRRQDGDMRRRWRTKVKQEKEETSIVVKKERDASVAVPAWCMNSNAIIRPWGELGTPGSKKVKIEPEDDFADRKIKIEPAKEKNTKEDKIKAEPGVAETKKGANAKNDADARKSEDSAETALPGRVIKKAIKLEIEIKKEQAATKPEVSKIVDAAEGRAPDSAQMRATAPSNGAALPVEPESASEEDQADFGGEVPRSQAVDRLTQNVSTSAVAAVEASHPQQVLAQVRDDLRKLPLADLRDACRGNNLEARGAKEDLVVRLAALALEEPAENGAKATAKETTQSAKPVRAKAANASRAGATKRSMDDGPLQDSAGEEHSHVRAKIEEFDAAAIVSEEFDFEFEESRLDQEGEEEFNFDAAIHAPEKPPTIADTQVQAIGHQKSGENAVTQPKPSNPTGGKGAKAKQAPLKAPGNTRPQKRPSSTLDDQTNNGTASKCVRGAGKKLPQEVVDASTPESNDANVVRCRICAQPNAGTFSSCDACTTTLSAKRGLLFGNDQLVWCRGFGPVWPACIDAVSFKADDDSKPYWVKFFGESSHAWVCEGKLLAWDSKKAAALDTFPKKWRSQMAAAMDEAEVRIIQDETAELLRQ